MYYVDPSGQSAVDCQSNGNNSRNLTSWLVREMAAQGNDWPIWPGIGTLMTASNSALNTAASQLAKAAWDSVSKNSHIMSEGKKWIAREIAVGGGARVISYVWWKEMVKNEARWDFKHQIGKEPPNGLGESIMLCDNETCDWYEYSMPGNIFYAYIGRVSGFSEVELRAGAVFAQQTDPNNVPSKNDWKPSWSPIGLDQASDEAAITLGFRLYDMAHGSSDPSTVMASFKTVLGQYKAGLEHKTVPFISYDARLPIGPDGPEFPFGRFDGKNGIGMFGW